MLRHVQIILVTLTVAGAELGAAPVQWSGNGHFYEFVPDPGITWTDARTAALNKTHNGLTGYLYTGTSQEENDFVRDTFQNGTGTFGWISASDAGEEGVWRWMDGPEAGEQFWAGDVNGTETPPFNFAAWGGLDPTGGDQNYAVMALGLFQQVDPGEWGDTNNTGDGAPNAGYFVEYGTVNVPAASGWGVIILALATAGTATLLLRRRKVST